MKAGIAGGAAALVLARIRRAKDYDPEAFGFVRPSARPSIGFFAAYMFWMLASDALVGWRGPWDFEPWRQAPYAASALRLIAVCMLGPMAEELLFRGLLFRWLSQRMTAPVVIAVTAISWAMLHYTYSWTVIAIIVVDGVLLGLVRWKSGSILPPILMHAVYNLYAIW
jgi:membrane protease YdiL (CAAX protease family)